MGDAYAHAMQVQNASLTLGCYIIYPVPHSDWVSPIQVVPKKGGMTVVENNKNELIP